MNELAIIPECYTDTNLIETLVPPIRGYNHQKNCGQVANTMQKKFADKFALGIIDKDKKTIKYLEEFDLIVDTGSLCLHKHKSRYHYIIQIAPAVERFILDSAKSVNISLVDYELSDDLDGLKGYTKNQKSKKDINLKNGFKALKSSTNFSLLANWIRYMKEEEFNCDIEVLKDMAK